MNDNTLMTAMAEVMERSKALRVEAQNQKGYLDTLLRHTKVERSLINRLDHVCRLVDNIQQDGDVLVPQQYLHSLLM